MANWVRSFCELNNIDPTRIVKRARHSLHLSRPDGLIEAHFVGKPCHYQDGDGNWQPIDTALVDLGNGYYGAAGVIVRFNKADRTVEIVGSGYSQRTTRVAVLRPSTQALVGTPLSVPVGSISGDSMVASGTIGGAGWEHRLTLTEDGVRETLTLASKPTLGGAVKGTDYLVLETAVSGVSFPDGLLTEFMVGGHNSPLPTAEDASGAKPDCKRWARTVGGVQYIYTGIPVSWLASAVYPVVVDPDFPGDAADGYVQGYGATYANARLNSYIYSTSGWTAYIGQTTDYYVYRAYYKFDTSSIGAGNNVIQVNLNLAIATDYSTTDFDVQIVKQNWSAQDPLSASNIEAAFDGCLGGALDNDIWRNTAGASINVLYPSGNLDTAWVDTTGNTYYSLRSSRDTNATTPSGNVERVYVSCAEHGTAAYRPVLTVVYSAGGPARRPRMLLMGVG